MKNLSLLFIAFLLLQLTSFAQAPTIQWEKLLWGPDNSIHQTDDGGYIISATDNEFSPERPFIILTDSNGETILTKLFDGPERIRGVCMQPTLDGNYILLGDIISDPDSIYLLKIDDNGQSLWEHKIGDSINGYLSKWIEQTTDSGYIIVGTLIGEHPHDGPLFAMKISRDGNVEWNKIFDFVYWHRRSQGCVKQTEDNGYIIMGGSNSGIHRDFLLKLDAEGDSIWAKNYSGGEGLFNSLIITDDDGFLVTGGKNDSLWVVRTNSDGDSIWTKEFSSNVQTQGSYGIQTTTGEYVILGMSGPPLFQSPFLIKFNEQGDSLWCVEWSMIGGAEWIGLRDLKETSDGGFIVLADLWLLFRYIGSCFTKFSPEPIPVELRSFTASTSRGNVYLNWITATETNNQGFEIERKIIQGENTVEWITIGFREGQGTTTDLKEYFYVDDISSITANSLAYRLKQIDYDGSYEYSDEVLIANPAPINFALHQNYPNPFNPVTTISYSIPIKSQVELVIYNTLGERIKKLVNKEKEAGSYQIEFDATVLPSGIYFYRLQAGSFVETKKMVLLK